MKRSSVWQVLPLVLFITTVTAQSVFIDQVPLYASLKSCAEAAISTIVRDMVYGCGDQGLTTSYSCFCGASSSYFASVISTAVNNACTATDTSAASTATVIFNSYCHLGMAASATVRSSPGSMTAAATSTMIVTSMQSTGTPAASTTSDTTSRTNTDTPQSATASAKTTTGLSSEAETAIIAVCVVVGVAALIGIGVFVYLRHKKPPRLTDMSRI